MSLWEKGERLGQGDWLAYTTITPPSITRLAVS